MKKRRFIPFLTVLLLCLCALTVSAETKCPCGCGCANCCNNYYQLCQPHGYWTTDGYFYVPVEYYTSSGKHISAGYYPKGELPEEALGASGYYSSAPMVKPDKVETKETTTTKTTNTTFSVTFPEGVDSQIVYVPGVGTVLANRNGTFQILK
ncbi:hypothetical protein IJ090_03210 [Candidatus Saccharibacteria bacterium]|nr:hypothetical protein [Candidatus Saccharibacteria bacterium]